MSVFICQECEQQRDADTEGCEEWNGELVCEDCFTELNACDHVFIFKKDTEGDGRDCSYFECNVPGCGRQFYKNDVPDDIGIND